MDVASDDGLPSLDYPEAFQPPLVLEPVTSQHMAHRNWPNSICTQLGELFITKGPLAWLAPTPPHPTSFSPTCTPQTPASLSHPIPHPNSKAARPAMPSHLSSSPLSEELEVPGLLLGATASSSVSGHTSGHSTDGGREGSTKPASSGCGRSSKKKDEETQGVEHSEVRSTLHLPNGWAFGGMFCRGSALCQDPVGRFLVLQLCKSLKERPTTLQNDAKLTFGQKHWHVHVLPHVSGVGLWASAAIGTGFRCVVGEEVRHVATEGVATSELRLEARSFKHASMM